MPAGRCVSSTHACCDLGLNAFCGVAGSFYSDLPQVESVGVTLQYDMGAPLHSPIWLDGYQFFQVSEAGLRAMSQFLLNSCPLSYIQSFMLLTCEICQTCQMAFTVVVLTVCQMGSGSGL